tara:strand:+ start:2545 stop:2952 length:408 start_codon:yes stop_codon:yes gene_type:complete
MKKGFIAGNFDVIHPGYVELFKSMNKNCDQQYILLHDDPTIERPEKSKPILSISERREILNYFFDNPVILSYNTEAELLFLIESIDPDLRFLGDDYADSSFTGDDLYIPIKWVDRGHGWSTSKFKSLISNSSNDS